MPATLSIAMERTLERDVEAAVRRFLDLVGNDYDVADAFVYGSRARGTARPDSDTDVAVLLKGEPRRFLPVKLAMTDVAYDIFIDTGIDISPLPVWMDEWRNPDDYPTPALLRDIERDGIRL